MVFEADMVKLDVTPCQAQRRIAVRDIGRLLEHLHDPSRAGQRTRQQQKDIGDHHERVHDLHDIAQDAGQLSDLHGAREDQMPAKPQDGDAGGIHGQLKGRQIQYGVMERVLRCLHQLMIDRVEFLFFIFAAHEGLDGADGRQVFLHDGIHPVDRLLQQRIHRRDLAHDQKQDDPQQRRADDEHECQFAIDHERHRDAQHEHDRTAHHRPQTGADDVLHDIDIARHARDQRCVFEMVEIGKGICLDRRELPLTQLGRKPIGRNGRIARIQQAGDQGEQRTAAHLHALHEDVVHIMRGHADIDHIGHDHRDDHLKGAFHDDEQRREHERATVWLHARKDLAQITHLAHPLFLRSDCHKREAENHKTGPARCGQSPAASPLPAGHRSLPTGPAPPLPSL